MLFRNSRIRWHFLFFAAVYLVIFCLFYYRYVPLVTPFQIILIPILFILFVLTMTNVQWGILFFIFAFPLINNLPYFFGIYGHIPHAPTALVLFLAFFAGWLVHSVFSKSEISFEHPIFKPLILLSLLIFVSGIITFLRYANFYPFLSDYVYELITNTNGVTAGGAIMSSVFFSLNYLTGFAFFFILLNTVKEKEFIRKILVVLLISTSISIAFGFFQHYKDIEIANNPISFTQGFINGTFKDAMSFGGYLAVLIPVILSMVFFFKGIVRVFSFLVFISAVFILPNTGSRSGLAALSLSLVFFLGFYLISLKKQESFSLKKIVSLGAVILLIAAVIISVLISSKDSIVYKRLDELRISYKEGGVKKALAERWSNRWKMAVNMIKDYPLTGVGIGAFIIELPNYEEITKPSLKRSTDSAENYFLQVGSELGIIGLFFSLWVFWEIFKQIKRGFAKYLSHDKWKYIQIGVSCGIISMFMIFFVHTYIGSYEIKYTFWLLVGSLLILEKNGNKPESRIHLSKNFKIFSLVLVLIFSGLHLWNSTHSLSLKNRTQLLDLKQNFGLYRLEKTQDGREFRWTRGYGGLTIKIEKPVIEIPMLASHPDIEKNPLRVKIYLIKDFFKEKRMLDEVVLTENSWKTYEYYVPEEVNRQAILLFKVSRTWNPLKTFGTPDPRNLGIAVGEINFKTLNH